MVIGGSRLVQGRFLWLFMFTGCFFYGSRFVFMVMHGSRLVFHGSRSVFMGFHGSRLVFHGSRLVFMVFHGSRLVFMVPGGF